MSDQDIADLRAAGDVVEDVPTPAAPLPDVPTAPEPEAEPPRSVESSEALPPTVSAPVELGAIETAPAEDDTPDVSRERRRGQPPSAQTRASALLREHLKAGPKPGALVEAAAEKADIAKAELIRAADALGVRTQRGQWWIPG